MTWRKRTAVAVILVLLGWIFSRWYLLNEFQPGFLSTGPNGSETPKSVGIPYERLGIPSSNRKLDGYLVRVPSDCQPQVALLVFHGAGETISDWVEGQRFLYDHCIGSVVFDYSGDGDSSKPRTVKNLDDDAVAAYSYFASEYPRDQRLCVLGHSMGNAIMLEALPNFKPAPSCVVVANAFSSLRDAAVQSGTPRVFTYFMPDVWNNVRNISRAHSPLLLVHSDADLVEPVLMGKRIFQAAPEPKRIALLHGFPHNALYQHPSEQWWASALQFVRGQVAGSDTSGVP